MEPLIIDFIIYVNMNHEYRKVQGLVGDASFSVVLPKSYANHLGIAKGDFVKVQEEEGRIIIQKA